MVKEENKKKKPELPGEDPRLHATSHSYRRVSIKGKIIESGEVLSWQSRVDSEKLIRIKGVGIPYADLLEAAGVDTLEELAGRNAGNLYDKIIETNLRRKLVRKVPSRKQVENWIKQARNSLKVVKC